jgi:hypothetical protein
MKYAVEITFVIEVEADDPEDAEDMGWDWRPEDPDGNYVSAESSNVIGAV